MASTLLALLLAAFAGDSSCTILHFTTGWCQPCRQMQPALDQLRSRGWDVRAIDTDQQRAIAQQFNVQHLPTLVILSGQREVDRIVGLASHAQIEKRVERAAARTRPSRGISQNQLGVDGAPSARPNSGGPRAGSLAAEPIVRGQSPALSAVPRAVANTLANSAVAGGISPTPTGRTQPPSKSTLSIDQAIDRAARATVRIRVDEGNTIAYGTGTIVDVRGDEALVLTCGHLFRDMQPGTQLTVDLFAGTPQEINVPSQLIDFTAEEVDIGLISMRIPVMIEPVEILPRNTQLRTDQSVFSFGCDHGANPTRRDTRISRINRYLGAANVEILGAPAVGRSGGGLFDDQGRLIGVCNAANANEDEGIYAAAEVIYAQLERLDLAELFDAPPQPSPAVQLATTTSPLPTRSPSAAPAGLAGAPLRQISPAETSPSRGPNSSPNAWPDESITFAGGAPEVPGTAAAAQVICIVRDAQGNDRMVTIHTPSAELLERIRLDAHQ